MQPAPNATLTCKRNCSAKPVLMRRADRASNGSIPGANMPASLSKSLYVTKSESCGANITPKSISLKQNATTVHSSTATTMRMSTVRNSSR